MSAAFHTRPEGEEKHTNPSCNAGDCRLGGSG
jgi:hypothetical protein